MKRKVLHVVGGMDRGGVETWLMHVLRHIDPSRFQMDFLVHTVRPCAYDDEILARGAKIIPCLAPRTPLRYARNFFGILREHGPYDVVHSHVHHFSGLVLTLARLARVPVRIAHSHSDTSVVQKGTRGFRRAYVTAMRHMMRAGATARLAVSRESGVALYGPGWDRGGRSGILNCGIDLDRFRIGDDGGETRKALGLSRECLVMGHVGSFREEKNHIFLVDIAEAVFRQNGDARLILVGEGPQRALVERKVQKRGIGDKVLFLGARPDVPDLMRNAMDVMVLPSLREGLPMVAVEAQAADLPIIVSDALTPELDMRAGLVDRVSLSEAAWVWAARVLAKRGRKVRDGSGLRAIEESPFAIEKGLKQLENAYAGRIARAL